jgi:hypothetical protein
MIMGKEIPVKSGTQISVEQWLGVEGLLNQTERCEKDGHKQTVAFSTYERAFTQVCFTCKKVRTNGEITQTI